ncbi:MAG: hypothetical protein WCX22_09125 [Methanoregula sp.]
MENGYRIVMIFALLIAGIAPVAAEDTTGSDQGWYVIHCNVYGSKVYFDDKYVGTVQSGTLTIPVSTTGTPYTTLRVQKNGYTTFTSAIVQVPSKGESIDLYATLNVVPDTTQTLEGGDVGWYVVHCNINGATVMFDTSNKGEISQGMVYVPVYSTGTPYTEYTVTKDGYTTFTGTLTTMPGKGETIDLYATLNAAATTATPTLIGGNIGWYVVHCNVEGATVSFDNDAKGQIVQGNLTVQVYVTGTPYKTFTVYKGGYVPYTGTIDTYPAKGESVDLYATLNAQPGTATTTTTPTQKSPVSIWICCLSIVIAGAVVLAHSRK